MLHAETPLAIEPPGVEGADSPLSEPVESLQSVLADIQARVAPLWPLPDFVAVNPFVGMTDHDFLAARAKLRRVSDAEMLMQPSYFRGLYSDRAFTDEHVRLALEECQASLSGLDAEQILKKIESLLHHAQPAAAIPARRRTVAEVTDRASGSGWVTAITNEVSKFCAAHYDQGQAAWPSPWRKLPFYQAWRESALRDRRIERLGMNGFREFVAQLPATPEAAIERLLADLNVPPGQRHEVLLCQLYSIAGWAAYVKYRADQATDTGLERDDLVGLLAIRLAYDAGLVNAGLISPAEMNAKISVGAGGLAGDSTGAATALADDKVEVAARYVLQVASEIAFRQGLLAALDSGQKPTSHDAARKAVQMVFCIDVRSEPIRRHLESTSAGIETFGFAGFFGLPFELVPLGDAHGAAQCPVLLKPGFQVHEVLRDADESMRTDAVQRRGSIRTGRKIWKSFQTSAASCFSFVEAMGLFYFGSLLADSLGLRGSARDGRFDGVPAADRDRLGPAPCDQAAAGLTQHQQADLAEGMLRNLGLTANFARLVVVCGHGSETANNPYQAALECGACGGHSGEANARFAASLLNDPKVRTVLAQRGIELPWDTRFVPAVHITTTDEIQFFDLGTLPESHQSDLDQLRAWVATAGALNRVERAARMGEVPADDLLLRSRAWSEVRPEWGLAANAAFVVAPRARTASVNLKGRSFLHSYDFRQDPELRVLELIMTAPMVVANWINLQYYASTVDNRAFGSGNKVIHNVVGQLGILEGNAGDLMTGLPLQSVHDGRQLQHQPLRLLVVIEAPRTAIQTIVAKHDLVRDLVCNGWLHLVAIDEGRFYRYSESGTWTEELKAGSVALSA